MERTKLLQQIYARLARLEDSREEARIKNEPTEQIDVEMKELRIKLQTVMNSVCPVIKGF
jgi:hypothetical protein